MDNDKRSGYRVVESDTFRIQRKKRNNWKYWYNTERTIGTQVVCGILLFIFLVVLIILWCCGVHIRWYVYEIAPILFGIIIIARRSYKYEFNSLEAATTFLEGRIKDEEAQERRMEELKRKASNPKYHYIDGQFHEE